MGFFNRNGRAPAPPANMGQRPPMAPQMPQAQLPPLSAGPMTAQQQAGATAAQKAFNAMPVYKPAQPIGGGNMDTSNMGGFNAAPANVATGAIQNAFNVMSKGFKKGGKVSANGKSTKSSASTASRRGDGIAQRGKTRGKFV